MPRVRALLAGTGTVAAVGALLVAGINGGYPASRPQLRSGAAWLASASVGQLTLLDGATAEIAAQVQVASRGDRVRDLVHLELLADLVQADCAHDHLVKAAAGRPRASR